MGTMKKNNKGMWIVVALFVLLVAGLVINFMYGS